MLRPSSELPVSVSLGVGTLELFCSELLPVAWGSACSACSIPASLSSLGEGRAGRLSSNEESCSSPKSSSVFCGRCPGPEFLFPAESSAWQELHRCVWSRARKRQPGVKLCKHPPRHSASQRAGCQQRSFYSRILFHSCV